MNRLILKHRAGRYLVAVLFALTVGAFTVASPAAASAEELKPDELQGTWSLDLESVDWRAIPGWESLDEETYKMAMEGVRDAVGDMKLILSEESWVVQSNMLNMKATYDTVQKEDHRLCLKMKSIESYEQSGQKIPTEGIDLSQLPETCIEKREGVLWMTQEGQPLDFPLKKEK